MRINIYAEELTAESIFITKQVDGRTFYGIRLYLKSPTELHFTGNDDDRSAITFWVPYYEGRNHHDELVTVIQKLLSTAWNARSHDGQ